MDPEDAADAMEGEDNDNISGDGGGDDDDGAGGQPEYVKKEYIARPYQSNSGALENVQENIINNQRPLLGLNVYRKRREFGQDNIGYVEKDATESFSQDLRSNIKNIMYMTQKKVLERGFQAACAMKRFQSQTYKGRSVNKAIQYDTNDFISSASDRQDAIKTEEEIKKDNELNEKLNKFINRVAFRIEEALQSNELINVFQDDFAVLGDAEAALMGSVNTSGFQSRTYLENDYCKDKRVTCLKFHPTRPYLVAMSMMDNMDFDTRSQISGKSFESYVLVLNFSDAFIITLNYVLETPVEITTIEWHPDNPNVLIGGCLNGQLIVWDLSAQDRRITTGQKSKAATGDDDEGGGNQEADDGKSQSIIKMKHLVQSHHVVSHKNFVSDVQFIPPTVKTDKRNPSNGKHTHLISISEDSVVNIWDCRQVEKDQIKGQDGGQIWRPFLTINVFKQDGSGELGLMRLILQPHQNTFTFWGVSDEGYLCLIDWSIKPLNTGGDDAGPKFAEHVRRSYEEYGSMREDRPALALERSPFFPNLILTVHNFQFAVWSIDLEDYERPVFESAPTFGAANTCGAFSPTRPGVIYITKTNGIDVWDFLDQSSKPSLTFNTTSPFMYCKFQYYKHQDNKQYMALGDKLNGTLFLYEIPANLKNIQENEEDNIKSFWEKEIKKCYFVLTQRESKKEDFNAKKVEDEKNKALADAANDITLEAKLQLELDEEDAYQELLLKYKAENNLISDEELQALQSKKKKK